MLEKGEGVKVEGRNGKETGLFLKCSGRFKMFIKMGFSKTRARRSVHEFYRTND